MNRSLIMKTLAVVSAAFGLVFLFWPNGLMAVYGADSLNGPGVYNSMLYGGCLLALAVVNWTASDSGAAEARHVVLGTLVANTLGFFTALVRQVIDQTVPPTAWLNVLIFSFLPSCSVISSSRRNRAAGPLQGLPLER